MKKLEKTSQEQGKAKPQKNLKNELLEGLNEEEPSLNLQEYQKLLTDETLLVAEMNKWETLGRKKQQPILDHIFTLCEKEKFSYINIIADCIFFDAENTSYPYQSLNTLIRVLLRNPAGSLQLIYEDKNKALFFAKMLEAQTREYVLPYNYNESDFSLETRMLEESRAIKPTKRKNLVSILLVLFKHENPSIRMLAAKIFFNISGRLIEEDIAELSTPILTLLKNSNLSNLDTKIFCLMGLIPFIYARWKKLSHETKLLLSNILLQIDFSDNTLLSPITESNSILSIPIFFLKMYPKTEERTKSYQENQEEYKGKIEIDKEKKNYLDAVKIAVQQIIKAMFREECKTQTSITQNIFDVLLHSNNKYISDETARCLESILKTPPKLILEKNENSTEDYTMIETPRSSPPNILTERIMPKNTESGMMKLLFEEGDPILCFVPRSKKSPLALNAYTKNVFSLYFKLKNKGDLCGSFHTSELATVVHFNSQKSFSIVADSMPLDKNSKVELDNLSNELILLQKCIINIQKVEDVFTLEQAVPNVQGFKAAFKKLHIPLCDLLENELKNKQAEKTIHKTTSLQFFQSTENSIALVDLTKTISELIKEVRKIRHELDQIKESAEKIAYFSKVVEAISERSELIQAFSSLENVKPDTDTLEKLKNHIHNLFELENFLESPVSDITSIELTTEFIENITEITQEIKKITAELNHIKEAPKKSAAFKKSVNALITSQDPKKKCLVM